MRHSLVDALLSLARARPSSGPAVRTPIKLAPSGIARQHGVEDELCVRPVAIGKQTKTDALDARLIARLLYERDCLGSQRGFLHRGPRSADALRLLVRNRSKLVEQQTRYRLQLTAIEDVLFPELK